MVDGANGAQSTGELNDLASARGRLGLLWEDVLLYGAIGVGTARYTLNEAKGSYSASRCSTTLPLSDFKEWALPCRPMLLRRAELRLRTVAIGRKEWFGVDQPDQIVEFRLLATMIALLSHTT